MILASAGSFVLETLSVLASGYIIHDAPICRLLWRRSTGYDLYLRTIAVGLILLILSSVLLYPLIPANVSLWKFTFNFENAPILTFLVALSLRGLVELVIVGRGIGNPKWKEKWVYDNLNEKELDQFIYERVVNKKMIMVTLENKKVYAGWPIEAPGNEDNQWLRFTPQWSGYRDADSRIIVETDYSKVLDTTLLTTNQMLISVEKIVTVQPFDEEVFQKFQL